MSDLPSIDRIAELQQLVADFSKVNRVVALADTGRLENDVEHSYGLAVTAWYLRGRIAPHLDIGKILRYALAHDIVEVYAGDTFIFDEAGTATKIEREREALARLKEEWQDFSELTDYTEHYMNKMDEEARFVYAVDKILPVLMVELGNPVAFWNKKNITLEMEHKNKVTIKQSEIIAPYYAKLIEWLEDRGNIPRD